jgi:hypothetical protein
VGTVGGTYERTSPDEDVPDRLLSRVGLTLGHRWYRALHEDVAQFVTLGAVRAWRRTESSLLPNPVPQPAQSPTTPDIVSQGLVGGVTVNVGAQWMVTSSPSPGATWGGQAGLDVIGCGCAPLPEW